MADGTAILEQIRAGGRADGRFPVHRPARPWQHIGVAAGAVDEALLEHGVMFDGSALAGWRDVSQSDMLLKPDLATAVLDPFSAQPSLILIYNVAEPTTGLGYERCPRSVAERAEAHLAASGVAERILIAAQDEFCVFDDVRFAIATNEAFFRVDSEEGRYNPGTRYDVGNSGHRPRPGAPLAVPPIEYMADLRAEMATMLATMGLDPRQQHHDTAASQNTIAIGADGLVRSADRRRFTSTSCAAWRIPTARARRSCRSRWRSSPARACRSSRRCGAPTGHCSPARASGRERRCLHYIGGILHHARALNAFTNPTTNSYRRLAPAAARRASWHMPPSTARLRSACRSPPRRRTSGSRRASPTPPPIPISRLPRC